MIVEVISLQLHSKKWTSKITVVTNSDICIHWQFLRAIFWCDLSIHQALSRLTPLPVIIFARQIFFSLNQRPCGNGSSGVQSRASATVMHVRPQINTAPNISTIPGRISRKLDSGSVILQEVLSNLEIPSREKMKLEKLGLVRCTIWSPDKVIPPHLPNLCHGRQSRK